MRRLDHFVVENVPRRCTLKSGMMEFTAIQRGLKVRRVGKARVLIYAPSGTLLFHNMNGPDCSRVGRRICDDKTYQRVLASDAGIPVARSSMFASEEMEEGLRFAGELGWPVVIKPTTLSRGRGVSANINSEEEFLHAWKRAVGAYAKTDRLRRILVEEHVEGEDFRLFVAGGRVVSVTHRVRAHVVGDGRATVRDLISAKNEERRKNVYLGGYPLPTDPAVMDAMHARGLDLSYTPANGEMVGLRSVSNLSAGGDSVDLTSDASQIFLGFAKKAVAVIPGLPYAGVDIITPDIRQCELGTRGVVGEVEFSPAPITHFPWRGEVQDMAGAILDHYIGA